MPHTLHLIRRSLAEEEAAMRQRIEDSRRLLSQPPVKVYQVFRGEVRRVNNTQRSEDGQPAD